MALFSYPVCTWLCQYVNMGVRKWLEKSAEKQKYKMRKTANPLSRKAFRAVSFSATKDKTKGNCESSCLLFLLSASQMSTALRTGKVVLSLYVHFMTRVSKYRFFTVYRPF